MKMKRQTLLVIGVAAVGALLMTTTCEARIRYRGRYSDRYRDNTEYTQSGLQLYAGFGGQGYEIEDRDYNYLDPHSSEGMLFLGAAVGLSRSVALYIEGSGSQHETDMGDYTFGYTHVGLKYAPNSNRRSSWQPYGKVSVGAIYLLQDHWHERGWNHDDNNGYVGPSFAFGLGVDKFVNRHVAFYGEAGMLMGKFDRRTGDGYDYELGNDIGVASARLQFGIRVRL